MYECMYETWNVWWKQRNGLSSLCSHWWKNYSHSQIQQLTPGNIGSGRMSQQSLSVCVSDFQSPSNTKYIKKQQSGWMKRNRQKQTPNKASLGFNALLKGSYSCWGRSLTSPWAAFSEFLLHINSQDWFSSLCRMRFFYFLPIVRVWKEMRREGRGREGKGGVKENPEHTKSLWQSPVEEWKNVRSRQQLFVWVNANVC